MTEAPRLEVLCSRGFPGFLAQAGVGLAFTTYQAGKLFLLGTTPEGRLSLYERTFPRCMGLCPDGDSLWLATLFQMWRLDNTLPAGQLHDGYDRLYVPRLAHTTGDLDVHDIAVDAQGRPVFVNTLFNCLATLSPRASFAPLWRPPFVSRLAAEDRCHLNGLALEDGRPAYVTAVAACDVADGWRDHRREGGVVLDVRSGEVVCDHLSMPHSPRLHDGKLWLLEAGSGFFGYVEDETFEPVTFCPGFTRGLCFAGGHAIVGLSKLRRSRTFADLPLGENLAALNAEPRCGLLVVDLETGDVAHWLRLDGAVEELYDVVALPGARRPMALGVLSDEIHRTITIGDPAPP